MNQSSLDRGRRVPFMLEYKFLTRRGALHDTSEEAGPSVTARSSPEEVRVALAGHIPRSVIGLVPESVARENKIVPLTLDGDTLLVAAVNAIDLSVADKLTFILNKTVRLVTGPEYAIRRAIDRHYGQTQTESVDSMLALSDEEEDSDDRASGYAGGPTFASRRDRGLLGMVRDAGRNLGKGVVKFEKGIKGISDLTTDVHIPADNTGLDRTARVGGSGMFYHVVEEGQRVLMRRADGTMGVVVGPKRVWRWGKTFRPMAHYVAHPGEFLIVRFRDGRQEHVAGPTEVWFDPRVHQEIVREDALQLAAKEAVVVYSRPEGGDTVSRRIVYGPGLFVPRPGEWLHTFTWHASQGGHTGVQKVPKGLVFQKLWLMPDQMYHDVSDVRTADDAVLTIRLMIFFELIDIDRMLETTHDPIGDFVNAATSDVVAFVGRLDFESFKRNTQPLNELETYRQLTGRAQQCGYRLNKVVYRGYGAPESLQQMHNEAIEARTKLQLQRATEEQAQDLEDYKLGSQIARATKRRTEQATEVDHDLEMARRRQESELRQRETVQTSSREQRRLEAEQTLEVRRRQDGSLRDHVAALRELGVDVTAYLTQGRADRVIEVRGEARPHIHVDQPGGERDGKGA